jgi:hypothetical protein
MGVREWRGGRGIYMIDIDMNYYLATASIHLFYSLSIVLNLVRQSITIVFLIFSLYS